MEGKYIGQLGSLECKMASNKKHLPSTANILKSSQRKLTSNFSWILNDDING